MTNSQHTLFSETASISDQLWTLWQQADHSDRERFLNQVRDEWVRRAHAKKAELRSQKKSKPARKRFTKLPDAARAIRIESETTSNKRTRHE